MKTIWKWEIPGIIAFSHDMPVGARFLHLTMEPQRAMWWEVPDTDAPRETRTFTFFGTGHDIPPTRCVYLGTVFDVPFVWHLHEVLPPQDVVAEGAD